MATREDNWDSPKSEQEWKEFWYEFFHGESISDEWKAEEKKRHRENRRANRIHKKHLVTCNKRKVACIEVKRISMYRLRDNGKNFCPTKPIPRRQNTLLRKMIRDIESYQTDWSY